MREMDNKMARASGNASNYMRASLQVVYQPYLPNTKIVRGKMTLSRTQNLVVSRGYLGYICKHS